MSGLKVTVNLTGHLKELYPHLEEQTSIELVQPVSVFTLLSRLGISSRMVLLVTIGDTLIGKETIIDQPCELNLVSPPAGG